MASTMLPLFAIEGDSGGAGSENFADEVPADGGDASPFEIKAINHDNMREAEQLCELFRRQYGMTYPLKEVYEPEFWFAGGEELDREPPFSSLVAVHGERIVGHIAVKSCNRSHRVNIFLPVVDPDYRRYAIRLSFQFWRCLESLAQKQGWKQIVHFYCNLDPIFQIVADKCFGSHEIGEIPMIDTSGETSAVVDAQPPAMTILFNDIDHNHDIATIFPPEEHLPVIEQIYRSLAIPREFSLDTTGRNSGERSGFKRISARAEPSGLNQEPFEICVNEALRLKQLRLLPSRIGGSDEMFALLRAVDTRTEADQMALMVLLPLEDPAAPVAARDLERAGYSFCGVLPEAADGDQILYCRHTRAFSLDHSERTAAESRSIEELSSRIAEARRAIR